MTATGLMTGKALLKEKTMLKRNLYTFRFIRKLLADAAGPVFLLIALFHFTASQAYAMDCSDCHKPTAHSTSCNETSCASCHAGKFPMNHPSGTGTPITGDLSSAQGINTACSICHVHEGKKHPFRVNLDPKVPNSYSDINLVCGQCHAGSGEPTPGILQFTAGQLSVFATNIHNSIPRTASYTWSVDPAVSNKALFDASASACTSGPCTYSWNFGDGTIASAEAVTSYIYPGSSSYMVVVKVTDNTGAATISPARQISVVSQNTAPVAVKLAPVVSGLNVTVSDRSTDAEDAPGTMTATVLCGNNTVKTGPDNTDLVCTYTTAGSYTIRHSVMDTGGLGSSSANVTVTVGGSTSRYAVSGTLTRQDGTPVSGGTLYLQVGTQAKYVAVSAAVTGNFTFTNVLPGTYTIRAIKGGLTFTNPAETVPSPIVVGSSDLTGVLVRSVQ
jgi:PKD repeat protein